VCGAAFAQVAGAELTERGDLFVSFQGGIEPNALPRTKLAPIASSPQVMNVCGDALHVADAQGRRHLASATSKVGDT
jgi:hypothetical protein